MELPFYNNNDEKFVPSIPFCPNEKCVRHGLLTIVFKKAAKRNAKSKRTGVQQENVSVPEGTSANSL